MTRQVELEPFDLVRQVLRSGVTAALVEGADERSHFHALVGLVLAQGRAAGKHGAYDAGLSPSL